MATSCALRPLAATRAWEQREDAWLARLQQIDASSLSGGDIATYRVLRETLDNGSVPLTLLRAQIERWIASEAPRCPR